MWLIVFTLIPLIGISYVSWHLWALLPLAAAWKTLVIVIGVVSFLLLFLDVTGKLDTLPLSFARVLYEIGTSSIMILLYLVMTFLVLDLGRLARLVPKDLLFNSWTGTAGIAVFILGLFIYANRHYINKVRVPLELTTNKHLEKNYKVVMMSDLHLGYHNTREELARWVDMVNAEEPDLVLIAGDIIDISVRPLIEENMAEEFRRIKAPVFACLGNHEYYSGTPQAQQFYKDAGITMLSDSMAVVDSCLCILGRDDQTNLRRKSLKDLTSVIDNNLYTIVLDHQPYHLERAEQCGVDFQLSGHTHRGQVWPISWITDAIYECSWGSHVRGKTRYYVSSGIGIWGGKFRIGTQSEYVVAEIKNKE